MCHSNIIRVTILMVTFEDKHTVSEKDNTWIMLITIICSLTIIIMTLAISQRTKYNLLCNVKVIVNIKDIISYLLVYWNL